MQGRQECLFLRRAWSCLAVDDRLDDLRADVVEDEVDRDPERVEELQFAMPAALSAPRSGMMTIRSCPGLRRHSAE
jgi:hypothetical protein